MPTRHRRLALSACAVGLIAALAPVATASAAPAWNFPAPWQPPGPPGGELSVTGKITFQGFPAGTTLTGGLGPTYEICVDRTDGRVFSAQAGSTIDASIEPDLSFLPSGCRYRATQSVWRLYLNSPPPFVGAVVFGLSQEARGAPYYMICGPTEGAIQCREKFDHLELDVVPRPSLAGLLSGTDARNGP
jgi:hypothetical protein